MFAILGRTLENVKSMKRENVGTPTKKKTKGQIRKETETDQIHLDLHHLLNPENPTKVEEKERKVKDPLRLQQKERMSLAHFSFDINAAKVMIVNSNTTAKSKKSTKRK